MIKFLDLKSAQNDYTSWFFYGKTRSGKSTAASTFPYPLFLQPVLEDSIESITDAEGQFVIIESMQDMLETLDELEKRHMRWVKGDDEAFPWETVVVESLTHYCDMIQEELVDDGHGGQVLMDKQKWGKLSAHLRTIHRRLKALPVHVVYIALVREVFDQKGELVRGEPMFVGQQSEKLPSACGGVVYFEQHGKKFKAHLRQHRKYAAGLRFKQLKDFSSPMMPFDFARVAKALAKK